MNIFIRRKILSICMIVMVFSAAGEALCQIPCSDGETSVYATKIDRKGKAKGWADENGAKYKPVQWTQKVRITPEGVMWKRTDQLAGGGKEEMTALIKNDSRIWVTSWTDVITTSSGKQESRLDVDFNDNRSDMIPGHVIAFLLRGVDLQAEGAEHDAHIWWGPKSFTRASWTVKGREEVTVPAGTFDCYVIKGKLLIDGKGFVSGLIQKILPSFFFYVTVEPPHLMVKFKMPSPSGETLTDTLISYTPGK